MKNIAIVTGASSGFGKEFVNLLSGERTLTRYGLSQEMRTGLIRLKSISVKNQSFSMDLSVKDNIKAFGTLEELKNAI